MSNAIKYTLKGNVLIQVNFEKEKKKFKISISDTGIGIPININQKLFYLFN